MNEQCAHNLTIVERKRANICGVAEVDFVTQEKIRITLCDKSKLIIGGENLKMNGFSKQSGSLVVDGKIDEIKYYSEKIGFVKKLLK